MRWFELSGRELRTLLAGAALVLLCLVALRGLRAVLWSGEFDVENARESLTMPARLDLNAARAHELQLLPGIGEKTAQAIVADREENGPYRNLEDLTRVRGIGPKTVERLRPHLMCMPPQQGSK